ncbi:endonuclease III [Microbacter margulisiae]|uniref:Endonuclease III n=1 Tax=Microbacter margulisiae TaxID=1350067 RepID=A0A7W5DNQ6_9PORP|nr:endonuclease III [Microbacter margulisiae]MBB3186187.1 endonuclease-3 [Microbacter margulisiae]
MTTQERCNLLIKWFEANMPAPQSELHYHSPYELLVAVVLSAQCTDKRVNIVTKSFFEKFPTIEKLANTTQEEVLEEIRSISYPNNKAKHLVAMARQVIEDFHGEIPANAETLQLLQGVGRKTANVVASIIYNQPVMAVDTHVFRIAERLGLTENSKSPFETEKVLTELFPPELIPKAHHWLILHGRYVCVARKPKCDQCGISPWCRFFQEHKNN